MRSALLFILVLSIEFSAIAQNLNFQSDFQHAKIIGFCECIHGSKTIETAQKEFIDSLMKHHGIRQVFIEQNDIYASQSELYKFVKSRDSSIDIVGYNPGYLYASYKWIQKNCAKSDPDLLAKINQILPQLDTNEAYYWYQLKQPEYDQLIYDLRKLKQLQPKLYQRKYVRQLEYDLSYLKHRAINGDQDRDSLMYQFLIGNFDTSGQSKIVLLGHCGHLAKNNPYRLKNLGKSLHLSFHLKYQLMGTDAKSVELQNSKKMSKNGRTGVLDNQMNQFLSSNNFLSGVYSVYLVGSDLNFKRKYKLNLKENYDWLYVFSAISLKRDN